MPKKEENANKERVRRSLTITITAS